MWFLHVFVNDTLGNPVPNSEVIIRNATGVLVFDEFTDIDGYCKWIRVTEYIENIGSKTLFTPHNITSYNETLIGWAKPIPTIENSKSVIVTLNSPRPTVDNIVIEGSVGGGWINDSVYVIESTDTFHAVGYNISVGFVSLVSANWNSNNTGVGDVDPGPGTSTTFTAKTDGVCYITAQNGSLSNRTGNLTVIWLVENLDQSTYYPCIQKAIDDANPGDRLSAKPWLYRENVIINKTVTLTGSGRGTTIINGNRSGNVIYINVDWVNISGFTMTNSYGSAVGIDSCSHIGIDDCEITMNSAQGIYARDIQYMTINNTEISLNEGSGIYVRGWNAEHITIKDCNISDNYYAGIYLEDIQSNTEITNCNISRNIWCGIYLSFSQYTSVKQCNITSNRDDGIVLQYSPYTAVENCNISSNNEWGIRLYGSDYSIRNCDIKSNYNGGIILYSVSDSEIIKTNISDTYNGIRAEDTSNTFITNSSIWNCSSYDLRLRSYSQLTLLNTTFDKTNVYYDDDTSQLTVMWFLHVLVNDTLGNPVPNSEVTVRNATDVIVHEEYTDINGYCEWIVVTEYKQDINSRIYHTAHNVTGSKDTITGWAFPEPNMDLSKLVAVTLSSSMPKIDYINITDMPNGTGLSDVMVSVGFTQWGYCSAYNYTSGYIGLVMAAWSADGGDSSLLNGTTAFHNGIHVGRQGGDIWLNASYNGLTASVYYDVLPPTVDYINITDTPGGSPVMNKTVSVGYIEHVNCSAYNHSIGYFDIKPADWTAQGGNSTLIGSTPGVSITINIGNASGTVWLNATFDSNFDSVKYTVLQGVDSINITDFFGNELVNQTASVGFEVWANCAAYNNTLGFVGNVTANWTVEGGTAIHLGSSPAVSSGINVGTTEGKVWLNASFEGLTDSVEYTVLAPTLDGIDITDGPGGPTIADKIVAVGYMEWGNCSAYNNTAGFLFTVVTNWTAGTAGGATPSFGPTPAVSSWINVGLRGGTVWWNASYFDGASWHNDSIVYTVPQPTPDYIRITDTPNGTLLTGGVVDIEFRVWGNCSAFNSTFGYINVVEAEWSAEGGSASLLDPAPAVMNGIDVGTKAGSVWLNASYNGLVDSIQYIISPPSPPQNLSISSGESYILITWNAPLPNGNAPATGYTIYRGTTPGGEVPYATVGDVNFYNDTSVINGNTYYYKVSSNNYLTEGPLSEDLYITAGAVPSPPQSSSVKAGEGYLLLTWNAPASDGGLPISGYRVYWGTAPGHENWFEDIGNILYYNDTDVTAGITYYYKVSAVNSKGEGPQSAEASGVPLGPPSSPTNLTAAAGNGYVYLSWDAPLFPGGSPIVNYRIYRGTSFGGETFLADIENITFYNDTSVINGQTYYYLVRAKNSAGEGSISTRVHATPAAPSVPENQLPTCTISTPTFNSRVSGLVEISGTASDPDGTVQLVEIRIDGGDWIAALGTTSWNHTWDASTVSKGQHTIYARAFDGQNYSAQFTIVVEVEPEVSHKEKAVYEEAWFWVLTVSIIIIVLLLILLLGKKIKKSPEKELVEEKPEGKPEEKIGEEPVEEEKPEEKPEEKIGEEPVEEEKPEEKPEAKIAEEPGEVKKPEGWEGPEEKPGKIVKKEAKGEKRLPPRPPHRRK
ncbi:MAG: right-handed parallel beta-helix repeat-containing protein [Thermoplasmata archaeon]|nr:MAG: right-handed parallel beta-helix repeat-containing protein [Thermoplasmata archaeon]